MSLIHSFDLDDTLFDIRHRAHMVRKDNRDLTDWEAYALACVDDLDGPAAPILNAIIRQQGGIGASLQSYVRHFGSDPDVDRGLSLAVDFIVISRRDNIARAQTIEQLNKRGWAPKELLLLKDENSNDERSQAAWKARAIRDYEARSGDTVVCHYDDNPAVTAELLRQGIPAVTISSEGSEFQGVLHG